MNQRPKPRAGHLVKREGGRVLGREKIYNDVWTEAAMHVAKRYGIPASIERRSYPDMGRAGGVRSNDGWMIDPEALVLATSRFGRHDPRLMDESIDWLVRYGRRINVLRLQSLHEQWPGIADDRVLAAIARDTGYFIQSLLVDLNSLLG